MIDLSQTRRSLPATMLDRSTYSIISVIKQAIGKDLTRFSIPVIWNEPLSFLQRLAECLEYSSLLDQAALTESSSERMHLITAFIVSGLSTHLERMSKPFNPLLGETYELKKEGSNCFHYISEQVSHHPPISALYARGENWTLTANIEPKIKFQGTNVVAISEGQWFLRLRKHSSLTRSDSQSSFHSVDETPSIDDEYTWKIPTVVIHNILFGYLWCEFQGEIDIEHIGTSQRANLIIKSHSWFASQATKLADTFKYSGFIYDNEEKQGAFHGNYGHCYYAIDNLDDFDIKSFDTCSIGGHNCIHLNIDPLIASPCDLFLTASSRLIWHRQFSSMTNNELDIRPNYYYFTPFTMCLNEENISMKLPPTDCRFRQDIRYLEQGDINASTDEKHRLEEQQRAEAKQREIEYEPLWFKLNENNQFVYTNEYEKRNFDHCPNLFTQA